MPASIRLFFSVLGRLSPALAGRLAAVLFARPRRHRRPAREQALIARGEPVALPRGLSANAWGAGPVVMLVHGWEGRGAQLGALVDPLVAAGYRVVALDGPAHGDSRGSSTTGPEFAEAMSATRDATGPLAALVGHSFGGFTSLLAVSRGLPVDRLVTISAPSSVPKVLDDFTRLIDLPPRALPAMVRSLEQRVKGPMASFEIDAFAHAVKIPVLVVHDTDDREVAYDNGTRLAAVLGARLMTTSGQGHRRILFAPDTIDAIVQFIEQGRVVGSSSNATAEHS